MGQEIVDDLQAAATSGKCVNVTLGSGQKIWSAGVKELRADDGVVLFFEPQRFGDETSTRSVELTDISGVAVTTLDYKGHSKD